LKFVRRSLINNEEEIDMHNNTERSGNEDGREERKRERERERGKACSDGSERTSKEKKPIEYNKHG